ncbi:EamA family transporter [Dactylosporangium salmoneum]|uniref:EamA family transporter n=1 Tax=Dactylosporangium salmoneum TaxID=53361 RepID=A0ABP5UR36_9ACTN
MRTNRAGAAMAVGSILCVQFGLAASVPLFEKLPPTGVAALRLGWGGLILLALVRPRVWRLDRQALLACAGLGVATAGMTTLFMAAIARLPMGTATALEFLGPLGVAVVRGRRTAKAWPLLAAAGVALLAEPWRAAINVEGVACALGAAVCWAAYILLTQRVGDEVSGLQGLAVSMPVAALIAAVVAGPAAFGRLTWQVALIGLGLALLVPVIPFSLEMLALRRLTAGAFGVLMSLEPAAALLIGLLVLRQVPGPAAVAGIALVVTASIGAQRSGGRAEPPAEDEAGRAEPPAGDEAGRAEPPAGDEAGRAEPLAGEETGRAEPPAEDETPGETPGEVRGDGVHTGPREPLTLG